MSEGPITWGILGYYKIPEFPEYLISKRGDVIKRDGTPVRSVRGIGAVIQLRKDGKPYLLSIKRLVKATFNEVH